MRNETWRYGWQHVLNSCLVCPGYRVRTAGKLKQIKKHLMKNKIPCTISEHSIKFPNGSEIFKVREGQSSKIFEYTHWKEESCSITEEGIKEILGRRISCELNR